MRQYIEHKINAKITGDLPDILIDIFYEDDFTNDHYVIQSRATEKLGSKNIPFVVYKNGQQLGKLEMTERDTTGFFETMFAGIGDADFKNEFYSKVSGSLSKEIDKFFKLYDNLVIANGITVEGNISRMKFLSGLKC